MRFLTSLVEQGLGSVLTFGINLWLIRNDEAASYGIYVFWYAVAWMLGTAQSTLATTHLYALPSEHDAPEQRRQPERFLLTTMLAIVAVAALGVLLGNVVLNGVGSPLAAFSSVAFVPAFLLFQYVRAFAFSRQRPLLAAILSAAVLVLAAMGLGLDFALGSLPTAQRVMAIAGLAYGGAALVVLLVLLAGLTPMFRIAELRRHAPILLGSVWLVIGAGSAEITNRLYGFAVVGRFGPQALATLSAMQVVIRPAWMLSAAWSSIGFPSMSGSRSRGDHRAIRRTLAVGIALTSAGSLVWSAAVLLGWTWISGTLYSGRYADIGWLAWLWGANVVLGSIVTVLNAGMLAMGEFRRLAILDVAAAGVVVLAMTMVLRGGYPLAIVATLLGQVMQIVQMAWILRLRLRAAPVAG